MRAHAQRWALGVAVALTAACQTEDAIDPSDASVALHDAGVADAASIVTDAGSASADLALRAQKFLLPAELPASRGNKYADDEAAATLGFALFFDRSLGNAASCATCHLPELAFVDRKSVSMGKSLGTRNAPTTFNAARLSVFFWDGSADSLWSQGIAPIENPVEMASTRLELAHHIAGSATLRADYEQVFGALPDVSAWPAAGKPGDAAFDSLSPSVQTEVNRIAANVGKAIEAYERKNTTSLSAVDRFLAGDTSQLSDVAQRGLNLFLTNGCDSCHSGPMLTDESFHDLGFPSLPGAAKDRGRAQGIEVLEANPFNLAGPYADPGDGVPDSLPPQAGEEGAFRTPSLRNVARTAPYGHDGALATLRDVLTIHAPAMNSDEVGAVIAFLTGLNGDYPLPPWSNWPSSQ